MSQVLVDVPSYGQAVGEYNAAVADLVRAQTRVRRADEACRRATESFSKAIEAAAQGPRCGKCDAKTLPGMFAEVCVRCSWGEV